MNSSLMPGGMVPEVTGGTIILDLADGTQAVITVPKARWSLNADIWRTGEMPPMFGGEEWYGVGFHPLDRLAAGAAFRLTHYYKPGGPRVRVEFPPEEAP